MTIADLIRREADAASRFAALTAGEPSDVFRRISVKLRNIAGVTEVHGLPGLLGYVACLRFSHSVTDEVRNGVLDVIDRILRGEGH